MKYINEAIVLNQLRVKNRIVLPPMATAKTPDGKVTEDLIQYYTEKSQGAYLGLIITEHAYISQQGIAHGGQVSISSDDDIEGLKTLASAIHKNQTKAIIQISHAGSATSQTITGMAPLSASALANKKFDGEMSIEMTQADIDSVVSDFSAAARRAKLAGFDGVEIHSAHGYLLNQFYSPLTNRRTDAYGAHTLEGRLKVHRKVIEAVRSVVGEDFTVGIRLGGCDYTNGGSTIEDSVHAGIILESYGIDFLDISGGMLGYRIPGNNQPGYFSEMTEQIKKHVSVPVILTGGITTAAQAEMLLEENKADMIGIGRAILRDSKWVQKQLSHVHK